MVWPGLRTRSWVGSLLLTGALAGGCADGDSARESGAGGGRSDGQAASLEHVSSASVTLLSGETAAVVVRYVDRNGDPRQEATVGFALVGRAEDSSLSQLSATTDDDGVARVHVTAGGTSTVFRVQATAEGATALAIDVAVSDASFGDLDVSIRPSTTARQVIDQRVDLFAQETCPTAAHLAQGADRTITLERTESSALFIGLPTNLAFTVVVRGTGPTGTDVRRNCVDNLRVQEDLVTSVDTSLVDLPLRMEGTYSVELSLTAGTDGAMWGDRLRDATSSYLAAGDGEANLLLDALEAVLRAEGNSVAADAVVAARAGGGLTGDLSSALAAGQGVASATEALADELSERFASLTIDASLTPTGAGEPLPARWDSSTLRIRGSEPGGTDSELSIDAQSIGASRGTLEGSFEAVRDRLTISRLSVPLALGSLAANVLQSLRLEPSVEDSIPPLLDDRGGCSTFEPWAAADPLVGGACSPDCAQRTCRQVLDAVAEAIRGQLGELDSLRSRLELLGRVPAVDDTGDLRVDAWTSSPLSGQWVSSDGTDQDVVAASLQGSRRVE